MNDIAVLIGLISFPGLIATILCDKLLVHAERWTSFKYGIYTFVFGVGSYVVLQVVVYAAHVLDRHLPWLSNKRELALWATLTSRESLSFAEVGWATFIAPFVAPHREDAHAPVAILAVVDFLEHCEDLVLRVAFAFCHCV